VVQCARAIGPGHGVSGPAYQLERAFLALGCTCERFTLESVGIGAGTATGGGPVRTLLRFWRDVAVFSTIGSLGLAWKYRRGRRDARTVVICHVDALFGDLFVVRAMHKGFLERHPSRRSMLLRNPLHALVLGRDWLRFRWGVHRHLVALSDRNRAEIVRLYGVPAERITVIPNGVDLDRFRPSDAHRRAVRAALGLAAGEFVAMFAGHEFERKGLRVVLEALRALAGRGLRVALMVAGRDSAARLSAEYADVWGAVRCLGHRDDIERYYAAADVFVLPSSFDVSPLVGPEALASGLPILMTDVGGVRDFLRDGENGWFIARDGADVAAKLARLAQDRATLRRLAQSARASVADRDWRVVAERFLALIDRLFPLPPPGGGARRA
jgi:UDP-glucose:(heptosyl)LPS alpha-1,3-glucosyltransferase